VIAGFETEGTADVFNGSDTKAARKTCPKELWNVARRRLDAINLALTLGDLASPGANLEKLKGNLAGFYSIRINEKYRVIFKFADGMSQRVQIIDYH